MNGADICAGNFNDGAETFSAVRVDEVLLWSSIENEERGGEERKKKRSSISICWRNSGLSAIFVPVLLSLLCERRRKKEGRERTTQKGEETDVYCVNVPASDSCFPEQLRRVSVYLLLVGEGRRRVEVGRGQSAGRC